MKTLAIALLATGLVEAAFHDELSARSDNLQNTQDDIKSYTHLNYGKPKADFASNQKTSSCRDCNLVTTPGVRAARIFVAGPSIPTSQPHVIKEAVKGTAVSVKSLSADNTKHLPYTRSSADNARITPPPKLLRREGDSDESVAENSNAEEGAAPENNDPEVTEDDDEEIEYVSLPDVTKYERQTCDSSCSMTTVATLCAQTETVDGEVRVTSKPCHLFTVVHTPEQDEPTPTPEITSALPVESPSPAKPTQSKKKETVIIGGSTKIVTEPCTYASTVVESPTPSPSSAAEPPSESIVAETTAPVVGSEPPTESAICPEDQNDPVGANQEMYFMVMSYSCWRRRSAAENCCNTYGTVVCSNTRQLVCDMKNDQYAREPLTECIRQYDSRARLSFAWAYRKNRAPQSTCCSLPDMACPPLCSEPQVPTSEPEPTPEVPEPTPEVPEPTPEVLEPIQEIPESETPIPTSIAVPKISNPIVELQLSSKTAPPITSATPTFPAFETSCDPSLPPDDTPPDVYIYTPMLNYTTEENRDHAYVCCQNYGGQVHCSTDRQLVCYAGTDSKVYDRVMKCLKHRLADVTIIPTGLQNSHRYQDRTCCSLTGTHCNYPCYSNEIPGSQPVTIPSITETSIRSSMVPEPSSSSSLANDDSSTQRKTSSFSSSSSLPENHHEVLTQVSIQSSIITSFPVIISSSTPVFSATPESLTYVPSLAVSSSHFEASPSSSFGSSLPNPISETRLSSSYALNMPSSVTHPTKSEATPFVSGTPSSSTNNRSSRSSGQNKPSDISSHASASSDSFFPASPSSLPAQSTANFPTPSCDSPDCKESTQVHPTPSCDSPDCKETPQVLPTPSCDSPDCKETPQVPTPSCDSPDCNETPQVLPTPSCDSPDCKETPQVLPTPSCDSPDCATSVQVYESKYVISSDGVAYTKVSTRTRTYVVHVTHTSVVGSVPTSLDQTSKVIGSVSRDTGAQPSHEPPHGEDSHNVPLDLLSSFTGILHASTPLPTTFARTSGPGLKNTTASCVGSSCYSADVAQGRSSRVTVVGGFVIMSLMFALGF